MSRKHTKQDSPPRKPKPVEPKVLPEAEQEFLGGKRIKDRNYGNWVDAVLKITDYFYPPVLFKTWSALAAISIALGRKCWFETREFDLRPNIFVILVGDPASGKSGSFKLPINECISVFEESIIASEPQKAADAHRWQAWLGRDHGPIHIMRDNLTPQSLTFHLDAVGRRWPNSQVNEHCINVVADEFGTFIKKNDRLMQPLMTKCWDTDQPIQVYTKHHGNDDIPDPYMTWLAGATPTSFVNNMPEDSEGQGLLSRCIVVFGTADKEKIKKHKRTGLRRSEGVSEQQKLWLRDDLSKIANLEGEFVLEDDDMIDELEEWINGEQVGKLTHPLMQHYNERRWSNIFKTAMCFSAARSDSMVVTREDWNRALNLLLETEKSMVPIMRLFGSSEVSKTMHHMIRWLCSQDARIDNSLMLTEVRYYARTFSEADAILGALQASDYIDKIEGRSVWRNKISKRDPSEFIS